MISQDRIDGLVGALLSSSKLREAFLIDPLGSVEQYNQSVYSRRFCTSPIELNDDERKLLVSLKMTGFSSIEEVYEALASALITQVVLVAQPVLVSSEPVVASVIGPEMIYPETVASLPIGVYPANLDELPSAKSSAA